MTAIQVYEQAIKPLSYQEKLTIARLILCEGETSETRNASPESGFAYLQSILPQIERITLKDEDLDQIHLGHPLSE